jgi:hypothetical protein
MKVIIPFTKLNKLQDKLLRQYRLKPVYTPMIQEYDYFNLLSRLWWEREPFVLLEHDILPWPGAIEELEACPRPWCSFSYHTKSTQWKSEGYGVFQTFGCCKFAPAIMDKVPDIFSKFASTSWNHLDAQFGHFMQEAGYLPHPHRPWVIHLKGLLDEENQASKGKQKAQEAQE